MCKITIKYYASWFMMGALPVLEEEWVGPINSQCPTQRSKPLQTHLELMGMMELLCHACFFKMTKINLLSSLQDNNILTCSMMLFAAVAVHEFAQICWRKSAFLKCLRFLVRISALANIRAELGLCVCSVRTNESFSTSDAHIVDYNAFFPLCERVVGLSSLFILWLGLGRCFNSCPKVGGPSFCRALPRKYISLHSRT